MIDSTAVTIFILFHQTVVAKIQAHTYTYTLTHTSIYVHTNNIYTYTTVYVEAIELHDMAETLFHSLDNYKPNLTSNFCMRLAHRTICNCHNWPTAFFDKN